MELDYRPKGRRDTWHTVRLLGRCFSLVLCLDRDCACVGKAWSLERWIRLMRVLMTFFSQFLSLELYSSLCLCVSTTLLDPVFLQQPYLFCYTAEYVKSHA